MIRRASSLLILVAITFVGCKKDVSNLSAVELEGKWNIYEAYRDGDLTTTLEDGYFDFRDSIFETNILGSPVSGSFIEKERKITHKSSLPITYDIVEYTSDTMHLETEIKGFSFLFKLQKGIDSIPPNN